MNTNQTCPSFDTLSAFVDDALSGPERLRLASHVDRCPSCAPVVQELRQLRSLFAALPDPARAFDLAPEIERRLAAEAGSASARPGRQPSRASRARRGRSWWQMALLAPGAAGALALGVWLGAGLMPAASWSPAGATAAQMAAFSSVPPGALCLASGSCGGATR